MVGDKETARRVPCFSFFGAYSFLESLYPPVHATAGSPLDSGLLRMERNEVPNQSPDRQIQTTHRRSLLMRPSCAIALVLPALRWHAPAPVQPVGGTKGKTHQKHPPPQQNIDHKARDKIHQPFTSSSSISVPQKSLGCRNRTGFPCAPVRGVPSPSTRAPSPTSRSRAARMSSTS